MSANNNNKDHGSGGTCSANLINQLTSLSANSKSRFPRLQECAHFHYEVSTVDIPKNFEVIMCYENDSDTTTGTSPSNTTSNTQAPKPNVNNGSNSNTNCLVNSSSNGITMNSSSGPDSNNIWFHLQVTSNDKKWIINRTYENFRYLDKFLHDCIFDRKFSDLEEPACNPTLSNNIDMTASIMSTISNISTSSSMSKRTNGKNSELAKQLRNSLALYLTRFCEIAFINPINCGPILNWFEIDNKGNRLFAIDDSPINIPGVAAAVVKKRYVAQGLDEISLDVGNMISVIDMPPSDESFWWRGKKELEVGFFPADCVELIKCNQVLPNNVTEHLPKLGPNQSVRLKHGKLITLLRSFFNTRPARMHLQSKGILKQRVFACDLGEHLSNTQQDVPKILKICTEFIEKNGTVDGIYRHTGLQSNIQKLRNAFDEEKWSEIEQEIYINDVHSVSSLLKMYFRELPNPLLTYQLYNKFITIAESLMKAVNIEDKIVEIYDVVQQLPPPHYRTLAFLMRHLHKLAEFSSETNMNTKNLAIVWAPNLLKSKEMDSKDCMQYDMLHSITLQANISEFLIANADTIFNDKFTSLLRKQDIKNNIAKTYRPISVCGSSGAKLLSLEEAQDKYKQVGPSELPKYHTVIEIPELKKKKNKEKDKDKKSSNNNSSNNGNTNSNVPSNIQIQQQFDNLQQQQQQQQQNSQNTLINSISSNSISTSVTTPINIPSNPTAANNSGSSAAPPGSSSPAFKSLLRNLRVGSFKHQTAASPQLEISNPTNRQLNLTPISINESESIKQQITPPTTTNLNIISGSLSRTASSTSTTTFKPASTGITSPNNDLKHDYSNCISQLQSAAAQAMGHINHSMVAGTTSTSFSSFSGTLSPPNTLHVPSLTVNSATSNANTTAPILLRTNKLNQSQTSIHSNIVQNNNQSQSVLSTFKDSNTNNSSPSNLTYSDSRKSESNPIPSKRKTIQNLTPISITAQPQIQQQQTQVLTNSNSLTNISSPLLSNKSQQQHPLADLNSELPQLTTAFSISSVHTDNNNKENQIISNQDKASSRKSIASTNNTCNNDDEMLRLVAYMNQFEKENISNAVTNQYHSSLISINQTHNTNQNQQLLEEKTANSIGELPSIEEPSKLRLSSSSLSSYAESLSNENNYEDMPNTNQKDNNKTIESATIKISSNESNPMIVTTQNLTSILRPHEIDRRTYVVNKIYDNLDNVVESDENGQNDKGNNLEDDDQYEKVILRHKDKNENEIIEKKNETVLENESKPKLVEPLLDEHIYVNVNNTFNKPKINSETTSSNDKTIINTSKIISPNKNEIKDVRRTPIIRESTGFDVANALKNANHYENNIFHIETLNKKKSLEIEEEQNNKMLHSPNSKIDNENFDANFDTELIELNNQIEKLLNKNPTSNGQSVDKEESVSLSNESLPKKIQALEPSLVKSVLFNRELKSKSDGEPTTQKMTQDILKKANDSPTRRMTISSISVATNDSTKQQEKPPVSLRSKSSANCVKPSSICKSISNDEIQQTVKPSQIRSSFKFKAEENKLNEEVNVVDTNHTEMNTKRKSSISSDEFKRRKSEKFADQENGKSIKNSSPASIVNSKNRQSFSTNTTPILEQFVDGDSSASLKNINKKSMSKSLQDNSKIANLKKVSIIDTNLFNNEIKNNEELSVKTKIKLMESIGNTKSTNNERSSSSSSTSSSCSSSRSPPISPNTIIELIPIQSDKQQQQQQKPPIVARTNLAPILTQPKPSLPETKFSKNQAPLPPLPLKSSSNESLDDISECSAVESASSHKNMVNSINSKPNEQQKLLNNSKEKRHTVKELMSKFEPK